MALGINKNLEWSDVAVILLPLVLARFLELVKCALLRTTHSCFASS